MMENKTQISRLIWKSVSLLVLSAWISSTVNGKAYSKCHVTLELKQCISQHHNINSSSITEKDRCEPDSICAHNFTISELDKKNVYGVNLVEQLLRTCCGSCVKFMKKENIDEIAQLSTPEMEKVDLAFPVLGKTGQNTYHGYYYIPIIEAPKVYYVTHANDQVLKDVIVSCLNLWPLLVVTGLMVLISGIV